MPDSSMNAGSARGVSKGDWTSALASRLSPLRLSPAREREIVDELSQHLDDAYREHVAAGASHEEAVGLSLAELDEDDLLTREMRPLRQASTPPPIVPGASRGRWAGDLLQDVRYALRTLAASKAWTTAVLLLLAFGIGANAVIFSVTHALLFAPLPGIAAPDALVRLGWTGVNDAVTDYDSYGNESRTSAADGGTRTSFPNAAFRELASDARGTAALFACAPYNQTSVIIDGRAELVEGFAASANYFSILGVRPLLGRLFVPDDDKPDATAVAVISARYWQSRFGGDPGVIGKTIRAGNILVTIVGVTPPDFTGVQHTLGNPPDISFPLALDARLNGSTRGAEGSALKSPNWAWLEVMGRLGPGTTPERLQAMLDGPFQAISRAAFDAYVKSLTDRQRANSRRKGEVPHLLVQRGSRGVYDPDDNSVMTAAILSVIVALILLIVCANVANLMLARAIVRHKEMSIRLSLGATRARLVRQLTTEGLLLASGGGVLGLVGAGWGVRLLSVALGQPLRVGVAERLLSSSTVGFTAVVSLATCALFAAAPALRATQVDVNAALKETSRTIAGRGGLVARALLVVQVMLSLVLLIGAGLFLRTVVNLQRVDVGFDPNNLLLIRIMPTVSGYDQARTTALYTALLDKLGALPGVRGAALSEPALLAGGTSSTNIFVKGRSYDLTQRRPPGTEIHRLVVSPDFFKVIGIPIVLGRPLTAQDDQRAPRVALINEAAAHEFFPGAPNPVGQRFGGSPTSTEETEVVGVVRDAKYRDLRESPPSTMYQTYLQTPRAAAFLELRTTVPPEKLTSAARDAVRDVAPTVPLAAVTTETEEIDRSFSQERVFAQAYAAFGGIALLLASIGLFGLMSYNVARRTAEMGIRMALGAQRGDLLRLVMRESMTLVVVGLAAGVAIALATGHYLASLLFGVPSKDPMTFLAAAAVMTAVCALAAFLPARRASRVDPMTALRYE
ncbi:MAG: ADOP family duplicated permease [Vicinamibacterales bacterium]